MWYDPARIFCYSREEIAWIIREAWYGWPPKTSGYIDTHEDIQNGSPPLSMPGQAAIEVLAEVAARVDGTGEDGETLIEELQGPAFDGVEISDYRRFRHYLSRPARAAINYVSGGRRKRRHYRRWKWENGRSA